VVPRHLGGRCPIEWTRSGDFVWCSLRCLEDYAG
jgi:hypothetical protein